MSRRKKVVVVGGGAAGFFGAVTCARLHPETDVILLEKSNKVLAKVRISGGGRCNVTHACFDNSRLAAHFPRGERELPALLAQFSAADTVRWFELRGVRLKTEADGRMFPVTDSSETIIRCLQREAEKQHVTVRTSAGVKAITRTEADSFLIHLQDGATVPAHRILVATGGNPNEASYRWLADLGHTILPPVPSLFTFNVPDSYLLDLAGVSVPQATVSIREADLRETGPLLITHWGFSGPAVLRLSAWGARHLHGTNYQFTVEINWLPEYSPEKLRENLVAYRDSNAKKIVAANPLFGLPIRLWKKITAQAGIGEQLRWAELSKRSLNQLITLLVAAPFQVRGKSTFKEEFVTCGGVSLDDIHLPSLESRHCRNLFFAGEVLNIDGITGGFNFQSAWTTGFIAGKNMG